MLWYNFKCQQWFKRTGFRHYFPLLLSESSSDAYWDDPRIRRENSEISEEEMNLKENSNKAAFIILSSSYIYSVWMHISLSVTDVALRWHSSLTEHCEWNSGPCDEIRLSKFTAFLSLDYALVNM